ncbi:sugar kinase [Tsukamurella soli]|uniref:Sugar kinase n=1 Tax=Tsukamurella soli TaxID=644556 RepID=A0ABP8JVP7_9ACTN
MTAAASGRSDWPEVVTVGETMALIRADEVGPLAQVSAARFGMGGAESNFAVALRRLGVSVAWVGRLGADSLGDKILRELAAEGIEAVATRDPVKPTGLMIKERRTAHNQRIWYYRDGNAGSRLERADVPEQHVAHARLLHVTGISLGLSDSASAAAQHAVDIARDNGTQVSFDLNYRSALWSPDVAGEAFRELVRRADLVFAGDEEAAMAVGPADDPVDLAVRLCEFGPSAAIVKLGAEGCVARIDGRTYRRRAVPVQPVDTVGAGDGFVAGYVAEHLAGADVESRLQTAVTVGAFACLVPGDWEGMPRRNELGLLAAAEPVSR